MGSHYFLDHPRISYSNLSTISVIYILHSPVSSTTLEHRHVRKGGGVAQWLGRRISDQGVPGSNPGRSTFCCGLEQVTFTLLSTG